MRSTKKLIFILLVMIMILALSIGCTPNEVPNQPTDIGDPIDERPKVEAKTINSTDKTSKENLSILDSYIIDINDDGSEEKIAMYVDAEIGPDGEIAWDDGQNWLFVVEGQDKEYILFDDYVQIGSIQFHIYDIQDDGFYITTTKSTTAGLTMTEYKFNKQESSFEAKEIYSTTGNVIMLYNSYGY